MQSNSESVFWSTIFSVGIALASCNLDNGLEFQNEDLAISHGIRGRIEFEGTWPHDVSEARLVASAQFPPDPSQPLDFFVFSDPIRVGAPFVDYSLTLAPETYEVIAVIFRQRNQPWDISNIMAVYAPLSPCTIIPDLSRAVEITSESTVVEGVDIIVDLSKGSITGSVTFTGTRPAEVGFAGIVALQHPLDLANLVPCGLGILPLDAQQAPYRIRVPADDYTLLVVAGETLENITSIADVRIVGTYFDPVNPNRPGVVEVLRNQETAKIDLVVDWNLF